MTEENEAPASQYGMTVEEGLAIFEQVMGTARSAALTTLQNLSDPTLTDAQKLDAIADTLTNQIQQAKHVADNYATRALTASNEAAAAAAQRVSQYAESIAMLRQSQQIGVFMDQVFKMHLSNVLKKAGPLGHIV